MQSIFKTKISIIVMAALAAAVLSGCTHEGDEIVLNSADAIWSGDAAVCASEGNSSDSSCTGNSTDNETAETIQAEPVSISVYVCGAVNESGVYELEEGARIVDAVRAAGDFTDDADSEYLNLAMPVTDGMKIQVPTREETAALADAGESQAMSVASGVDTSDPFVTDTGSKASASQSRGSQGSLVNINTADAATLCTLSGIGESRAAAIIAYREAHGGFKTIEDIQKVDGIKSGTFNRIKDNITV